MGPGAGHPKGSSANQQVFNPHRVISAVSRPLRWSCETALAQNLHDLVLELVIRKCDSSKTAVVLPPCLAMLRSP